METKLMLLGNEEGFSFFFVVIGPIDAHKMDTSFGIL